MTIPYTEVFLALLLAYMVYSVWAGIDGRYPIAAALVLLVVTAVVDALGMVASANTLAEYVFFLLAAGVVLLLIEHVREGRRTDASARTPTAVAAEPVPSDAADEAEAPSQEPLDRLEKQPVALVDAPREEEYNEEPQSDRDSEDGQHEKREDWMEERERGPDGDRRHEQGQYKVAAERVDPVPVGDLAER